MDTTKTNRKTHKSTKAPTGRKTPAPAKATAYTGAPIPATRVLNRRMKEFKNTVAHCWLIINDRNDTYTFANTYKDGVLPPSYRPDNYTYPLNEKNRKALEKKIDQFTEIEVDEWPSFVTSASRRGRKVSK